MFFIHFCFSLISLWSSSNSDFFLFLSILVLSFYISDSRFFSYVQVVVWGYLIQYDMCYSFFFYFMVDFGGENQQRSFHLYFPDFLQYEHHLLLLLSVCPFCGQFLVWEFLCHSSLFCSVSFYEFVVSMVREKGRGRIGMSCFYFVSAEALISPYCLLSIHCFVSKRYQLFSISIYLVLP